MALQFYRTSTDAASGAKTSLAMPLQLGPKAHLKAMTIGINPATGAGPVQVVIFYEDLTNNFAVPLASGWVRNDPNGTAYDSLNWQGDLPLQQATQQPEIIVLVRNDTGATVAVLLTVAVDQ